MDEHRVTARRSWLRRLAPAAVAGGLIVASAALRLPAVLGYDGPAVPHPFNLYEMGRVGAYSDIAHLYFRDRLWTHPVPYVDYRFEYPVLTGAFVWLASLVQGGVAAYFLASAALLLGFGVVAVRVLGRIDGASPWILAAAPALAFYGVLNWDLAAVCALLVALWLFQQRRDVPATAVLALSVAAKLFPIVVLPVVLALRAADRRWRSALRIAGTFAAVTVAVNAPAAIAPDGGIRESWLYFFRFSETRPPRATIWKPLVHDHSNLVSGSLLVAGLVAIAVLAARTSRPRARALIPASAASLLWMFATAKVYSPQYALWIFAALALVGAPVRMVVAFGLVDALVFATTFGPLYPGFGPFAPGGVPLEIQWAAYGARQLLTAALAAWVVRERLVRGRDSTVAAPRFTRASSMAWETGVAPGAR